MLSTKENDAACEACEVADIGDHDGEGHSQVGYVAVIVGHPRLLASYREFQAELCN